MSSDTIKGNIEFTGIFMSKSQAFIDFANENGMESYTLTLGESKPRNTKTLVIDNDRFLEIDERFDAISDAIKSVRDSIEDIDSMVTDFQQDFDEWREDVTEDAKD